MGLLLIGFVMLGSNRVSVCHEDIRLTCPSVCLSVCLLFCLLFCQTSLAIDLMDPLRAYYDRRRMNDG